MTGREVLSASKAMFAGTDPASHITAKEQKFDQ
jgi:hypothetical protein